jgi:hypothetical protein
VIVGLKMVNQLRLWRNNFWSGFTHLAAGLWITGDSIQKKIQKFSFCHISFELKGFNPSNNWTLNSEKDWKFSCGVDQFWQKIRSWNSSYDACFILAVTKIKKNRQKKKRNKTKHKLPLSVGLMKNKKSCT